MATEDEAVAAVQQGFPEIQTSMTVMEKLASMVETPEITQSRMLERFTTAESADDLFSDTVSNLETVSSEDMISTPFIAVNSATQGSIRDSGFAGSPFYMSIEAVDPISNILFIVNTSSPTAATKILRAKEKGILPQTLKFIQKDKPTKGGFYPLDLVYATEADVAAYAKTGSTKTEQEPF